MLLPRHMRVAGQPCNCMRPKACGASRGQCCVCADTWPQALAIQARPANMPAAARALAGLADDVWHAAGDTSADYNWCASRLQL